MATNQITTNANANTDDLFPFPIHRNPIADDYDVSREVLGDGKNGKVFKCTHRQTGKKCAIKILKNARTTRQEVILHRRACENCQYIVQLLDVYENHRGSVLYFYIVMECMEGGELFNRIQQRSERPYTERDAARYIRMIVEGVYHLHSMDIAHRDLKPENLLLTDETNDAILKLGDFGFAKEGNNELMPLLTPLYTAYYVAPEILSNSRYDKACDIWSMGVIMYILLCGYPPFYSQNSQLALSPGMKNRIKAGHYEFPDSPWSNISQEAKLTIQRMLTVDPAQRITIGEIRACQWLNELTSERSIDISSIQDPEIREQLQVAVASATDLQRRTDVDLGIQIQGPESSNVAIRAAERRQQENLNNHTHC
ncbi:unnamed protein product [Rotaria magnacalcarata]|uniref:non-specific serine/threonine protein kinase n=2 Tax=Rotaria magnacalcarata TaxID=392030 RepID=A0A816WQI0_9BILA|nr:unnamed protein product [Rotaria magnacalcarata]CAF2135250.1 unnamed protein product [Rotaria magnacalcarata]CAF2137152.1 unnamed protein product [Rotaria magnacalcarata]CAF2172652.1 unnamed protein product [Rotaria magnacalcarata]